MANQVIGKILAISEPQVMLSAGGAEYTKQRVLLDNSRYDFETGEKYENILPFDLINFRSGDIRQHFDEGDKVTVLFRLKGRTWHSKDDVEKVERGLSVVCYRIEAFEPEEQQRPVEQAGKPRAVRAGRAV